MILIYVINLIMSCNLSLLSSLFQYISSSMNIINNKKTSFIFLSFYFFLKKERTILTLQPLDPCIPKRHVC